MWSRLLNCLFQHASFSSISKLIVLKILYIFTHLWTTVLFHLTIDVIKICLSEVISWMGTITLWTLDSLPWMDQNLIFYFLASPFSHAKETSHKGLVLSVSEIREVPGSALSSRYNSLLSFCYFNPIPTWRVKPTHPVLQERYFGDVYDFCFFFTLYLWFLILSTASKFLFLRHL